ncbi:MAG: TIGR00725 family protein [Bacteroidota bacterium]
MKLIRKPQISVIGDSNPSQETYNAAYQIGKLLAKMGAIVITGGKLGIMEAVAKGVDEENGVSVGILPSSSKDESNFYNTIVMPTDMGHARNALVVLAADIVIAMGGGAGTLSELSFGWIYNKPILTLKGYGGWSDEFGNFKVDGKREDYIVECKSMAVLKKEIEKLCKSLGKTIKEAS